MVETGTLFLALLAVLCQVFLASMLLLGIGTLTGAQGRRYFHTAIDSLAPVAIPFAFAVALVTMFGSLFFSEVANYVPCRLCWIQRAFLYPQVLLMGLLMWRDNRWIRLVAVLLLIADIPVSIYHYLLEWYPTLETSVCDLSVPCNQVWFREFNYVSIPLMALTSALTVLTLIFISRRKYRQVADDSAD